MTGGSISTSSSDLLRQAVSRARSNPRARALLDQVYQQLQKAIDQRQPACSASGRCCRFEEYGHRLYVTPLELGVFLDQISEPLSPEVTPDHRPIQPLDPRPAAAQSGGVTVRLAVLTGRADAGGCRFQEGGLCGVHPVRPFGCRIFFCDPTAEQWQQDQYEQFHRQIKSAHAQLGIPYLYVEWRMALASLIGPG